MITQEELHAEIFLSACSSCGGDELFYTVSIISSYRLILISSWFIENERALYCFLLVSHAPV